ncbi:MAG: hypothetical protein QG658_384 [Patescibacteria group bacterium]|jgi:hypothetical protein|nr:hypothetical protein [Patescibacteria group bacterium]
MSDDVIFKQEVRDATFKCVADALETVWGTRPEALLPGARHSSAGCAIANTFATFMPHPVLVYTDSLLIANEGNADSLVAVWHTKVALMDDDSDDASDHAVWETFGDLPVYMVALPTCMQSFIKCFDEGLYRDLIDDMHDEQEELVLSSGGSGDGGTGGAPTLTGGSGSEGGGIHTQLGGSEASPFMVGGGCGGGTGGAPVMVGGSEAGGGA